MTMNGMDSTIRASFLSSQVKTFHPDGPFTADEVPTPFQYFAEPAQR
ncbi:hypothetical protein F383_13745 [Gossypium arboreum]|uniref:Uncharacterized protein n=1 Tax=Gossypium arboreum TaxID=29729 RepID=A0A0B0N6S6_GOSAR|nr:hypothetical protein F383_13745 [Gossypium arboreum]